MIKQHKKLDIEFPTYDLDKEVISIISAIGKFGGSLSKKGIQDELNIPHGSLGGPISSAKRYALIKSEEGSQNLGLTPIGWQVYRAKTDEERKLYLTRAFLNVNEFKSLILEKNFHELPQLSTIKKIFQEDYGVPEKYSARLAGLFRSNFSLLGLDFVSLKEMAGQKVTLANEEQEQSPKQEQAGENEGAFFDGIRLGFRLAKMSEEKPSKEKVSNILQMLIEETTAYPKLKNTLIQVREMVMEDYMSAQKAVEYIDDKISKMFGITLKETTKNEENQS